MYTRHGRWNAYSAVTTAITQPSRHSALCKRISLGLEHTIEPQARIEAQKPGEPGLDPELRSLVPRRQGQAPSPCLNVC